MLRTALPALPGDGWITGDNIRGIYEPFTYCLALGILTGTINLLVSCSHRRSGALLRRVWMRRVWNLNQTLITTLGYGVPYQPILSTRKISRGEVWIECYETILPFTLFLYCFTLGYGVPYQPANSLNQEDKYSTADINPLLTSIHLAFYILSLTTAESLGDDDFMLPNHAYLMSGCIRCYGLYPLYYPTRLTFTLPLLTLPS